MLVNTAGTQEIAAAKAGMDPKTACKYRRLGQVPSELPQAPRWRNRPDAFVEVWGEVCELLNVSAGLEAKTVFEYLQRRYVGQFGDGQLRTLQRRIKTWRATEGPAKEVFFAQQHPPGRLGASDFTHMEELGVTIQGQSFPHLIYHFVLTYSNWEAGNSVLFGKLREPLRRAAERGLGTGQGTAPASDRSAIDGGQQHERSSRLHGALQGTDALLRAGGRKDAGGTWQ